MLIILTIKFVTPYFPMYQPVSFSSGEATIKMVVPGLAKVHFHGFKAKSYDEWITPGKIVSIKKKRPPTKKKIGLWHDVIVIVK